jgi:hypothetical protein
MWDGRRSRTGRFNPLPSRYGFRLGLQNYGEKKTPYWEIFDDGLHTLNQARTRRLARLASFKGFSFSVHGYLRPQLGYFEPRPRWRVDGSPSSVSEERRTFGSQDLGSPPGHPWSTQLGRPMTTWETLTSIWAVGRGSISWKSVLGGVLEIGFNGRIVVESVKAPFASLAKIRKLLLSLQ